MEAIEIKTVEKLEIEYNAGNLWGWTSISNLDRDHSQMWKAKQSFHNDKFENCSRGTQISLINEFLFDGSRYRIGRTGFTNIKCAIMLDEFLSKSQENEN